MVLYRSATEHINKYPYAVLVPPHFAVKIGNEIESGLIKAPFYQPDDDRAVQRSRITIAHMVELFESKMPFTVIEDSDVLSILHHIDAYVEEIKPIYYQPEIKTYVGKILKLRDRIYFLFRRVMAIHPQWKTAYQDQQGIFDVLSSLYAAMGYQGTLPDTLLEELRQCPAMRSMTDATEPVLRPATTSECF